ncbi:ABC transporter permease [Algiphilus sp. W345]|uniref:ABC transporter permease n=1 Tax=Banduia mediterranea TaxID=3075609 RepID=A0ABU2WE20_9GAMM|nr:ABC transporter permease [Algiphilus sp. W345]MDT0495763.1 ABC transporter permease [Algiphilus sp. W345]
MGNTLTIASAEFRRIFVSPLAWAVLAVLQIIAGYVFAVTLYQISANPTALNDFLGVSDYVGANIFGFMTVLYLLVMPLMTMRAFSEERKSGSITLLFSAPVSLSQIVLGKFMGLFGFMLVMLLLVALMPLSLMFSTDLDLGRIAAGLFGLLLMLMAFGAAGLFVSTLTKEPTIAAIGGFGLLLLVWLVNVMAYQEGAYAEVFKQISLLSHYENLRRGVFNTSDVTYYLLFCVLFLWGSVQRLDMERN